MNIESFNSSTGFINDTVNQFQSATSNWLSNGTTVALHIFGMLAVLEFAWTGATLLLRKNDLGDVITGVTMKILSLSFFYMLIIEGATWIPDIIKSFWAIGGQIATVPVESPSAIINLGIQIAARLIQSAENLATLSNIPGSLDVMIVVGLVGIMLIIGMVLLALQLAVALIEAFIVVGGAFFMLGFLGSRWTSQWGEKYFGLAVSIGIKLLAIELIVGVAYAMVHDWSVILANENIGTIKGTIAATGTMLEIGVGSLLLGAIAIMVPSIASSMMNGSPSLSLGSVGGAAAAIGGGVVAAGAGAAMGGAALANSAIGAGKAAGALGASANSTMGGMKGLGAAFTEGAGAAGESGILGLGGPGASKGSQTAAKAVGGLGGLVSQAGKGMATAGQHGASALKGMAKDKFHGRSGPGANDIAQSLGDKAVQGHGTGTSGGNLANRVRAQHAPVSDEKGNSVGLGAAPDANASPVSQRLGGSGPDGGSSSQIGRQDTGTGNASGRNDTGSSQSTASQSGGSTNSAPGGNTSANPASTSGGDSIGGGGGPSRGGFTQTEGARFDQRTNHEKNIDSLQKIKEKYAPRGLPHDGGGGGMGGPNIRHTE